MNYVQLLEQVKHEAVRFFHNKENSNFTYHNLAHTEHVVAHAGQIGRHYQLTDKDFFIISTAAWFHDTGYYVNGALEHELRGSELASNYLKTLGVDEDTIQQVVDCILATQLPQKPKGLLEQIVCDADLFHFGTDGFAERNKLMRKEAEWRSAKKISKGDWRNGTIKLMQAHHFHTDYAINLLQGKKQQNIEKLKQKEDADEEGKVKENDASAAVAVSLKAAKADSTPEISNIKKPKADRPDRGVETMFRISSGNHQRLSDMADNKAHIMITTTSIIISVLLSLLLRKLEDNPHLIFPTLTLLIVCVTTMVFSILATRPTLPHGTFTQQDITDKKVNLLFFGNFYKMDYDDFNSGMQAMMNDREFLYGSLTRDVFSQGVVLGRKYRLLRLGYNIFMFGIIVSVLAFIVAAML